jgi:hypothetical protein
MSIGATINDGGGQRDFFNGGIAITSVYNRALSDLEILQNFYATRERFGL